MNDNLFIPSSPLGKSHKHADAYHHTSGAARYVDDSAAELVAMVYLSPVAHAAIDSFSLADAKRVKGVHCVLSSADIPGDPLVGPIIHDEPLLAMDEVLYHGQAMFLIVGETEACCREAASQIVVRFTPREAVLSIEDAIEAGSFHNAPHTIQRGAPGQQVHDVVEGVCVNPAQDHFYLETHAAIATPLENGCYHISSSTQHPTEVQKISASVLGIGANRVVCEVARMGGGFGGKESQASQIAALAALGAFYTNRSVKLWLDRDTDMRMTGKRHPFQSFYRAGFDAAHRLISFEVDIYSNGGWSSDLSIPVMDRALFHLDNIYYIENLRFTGLVCRTYIPSNTAFRGFGGPQGILVVEEAINRYAERKSLDPAKVREINLYREGREETPYGQQATKPRIERIYNTLLQQADYDARRAAVDAFNRKNQHVKRGIGFQGVKFGISFTKSLLNQAGALVQLYTDGTVQLNHSGTEMGQGLHTKMAAVCAHTLGVELDAVRVMNTATDKVPNTSPTAASSGADLNGQAVRIACETLIGRLRPLARTLLEAPADATLHFEGGYVMLDAERSRRIPFSQLALQAWVSQISLSATGFYRTPGIAYDQEKGRGTPFFYFAYGGAVTEIELSTLTGEYRIIRTDILHDVGDSLSPAIDKGQIEGAYVQGMGWLGMEEVIYNRDGRLLTYAPSTYKIPTMGDIPLQFDVSLLSDATADGVIHGSKAVGEPPFVLAISMVTALRHAIASVSGKEVSLHAPCTTESVLRAVYHQRGVEAPKSPFVLY